jgi:regulator of sigma E protease
VPSDLLTSLLSNAWAVLLVILFFGGSIFVHELGHFLAARWRGVHVERFSIGFGPAIWSWRAKDGVEYRIAWIPLGGYVLLPQLADLGPLEGAVTSDISKLPPVTYTSKVIVFLAGAFFNVMFALFLACIVWAVGMNERSDLITTRVGYVSQKLELPNKQTVPGPAYVAGLQVGDVITAVDGHRVSKWIDIPFRLVVGSGHSESQGRIATLSILRNGSPMEIVVRPQLIGEEEERKIGIQAGYELLVGRVTAHSPAEAAGFKPKDEIIKLNGAGVINVTTFAEIYDGAVDAPLAAVVRREGREETLTIPPHHKADTIDNLGVDFTTGFQMVHVSPIAQIGEIVDWTIQTFTSMFNRHSDVTFTKTANGPAGIIRGFYEAAQVGMMAVISFTILINISLAMFNLLPMPVLDGGQILFATIARLRGRALPLNLVMAAQGTFLVLLLSLAMYVTIFGDLRRWARDLKADRTRTTTTATPAAK